MANTRRLFFKGTAVSVCQGAPDFTRCAQVEAASSRGCLQKKESTIFSDGAFLERATRLELASRHPTNGNGHSREPCLTSYDFTRCAQVEAASSRGCLQKRAPSSQMVLFWSGRRGSNSLPGIPRMAMAIRGSPASPRMISRAARRSRQRVLGVVCKKESTIFSDGAFLERATRLELATSTLARSRSTR